MSSCVVETLTAGFICQRWQSANVENAEAIARKLSVAAIGNPTYPNPFFVVEPNGALLCHFIGGARHSGPGHQSCASDFL